MKFFAWRALAIGAVLILPACSFTEESLWPSLSGEEPGSAPPPPRASEPPQVQSALTPPQALPSRQPPLGTTNFKPTGVTPGQVTGTFVGQKISEWRGELSKLQVNISEHNHLLQNVRTKIVLDSQSYHGTVAAINARLQIGTTPGNPILVQQLSGAQTKLSRINDNIGEMNKLATEVGSDSTMSGYLSETLNASFSISGAVDEDHRQLAILEDEVHRTAVLVERLLREVSEDVRRQTAYVSTERGNLNLMGEGVRTGEIFGASLVNQAMASTAYPRANGSSAALPNANLTSRRPLVVVRFDRPNVPYQQALYNVVSRVLETQPGALFDVVGVTPNAGGPARIALNTAKARRHAESVLRSMVDMGLPPERAALSIDGSYSARENEVHLYLR